MPLHRLGYTVNYKNDTTHNACGYIKIIGVEATKRRNTNNNNNNNNNNTTTNNNNNNNNNCINVAFV